MAQYHFLVYGPYDMSRLKNVESSNAVVVCYSSGDFLFRLSKGYLVLVPSSHNLVLGRKRK